LEIPAHRVLEVEGKELEDEFDMYDEDANLCAGSSVDLLFRKNDGKRLNSLSLVIYMELSNEIAPICRSPEL
jgi:hypothetical protein